jgi:hypothetical protein
VLGITRWAGGWRVPRPALFAALLPGGRFVSRSGGCV